MLWGILWGHCSERMTDWITDRQPTEADGDFEGEVAVCRSPKVDEHSWMHWSYVGPSTPWKHTLGWTPPWPQPALAAPTTEPRQFVSIRRTIVAGEDHILDAIADDGTAWCLRMSLRSSWSPISPLPAREVPADA